MACSPTLKNSSVVSAKYTFRAAPVTSTLAQGAVSLNSTSTLQTATATSGPNAVSIRYNFDGSNPSCVLSDQTISAQAGSVTVQENTSYTAVACRQNYQPSCDPAATPPIACPTFAYTVQLTTPVFPAGHNTGPYVNDFAAGAATANNGAAPNPAAPSTYVAPAPGNPPTTAFPAPPVAGTLCYAVDAAGAASTAGCTAAGVCNATSTTTPPAVVGNTTNVLHVVACRPGYVASADAPATYAFNVAPIAVTGTGVNTVPNYVPTTTANYWNGGPTSDFTLTSATNSGAATKIRYSTATGNTLPAPPDVTCTQVCNNDASCTEVANGATVAGVAPFTTIKAIGCKADYTPSIERTVVYADPANIITVSPPIPADGSTLNNDAVVTLTTSSPATVCYTLGINNNTAASKPSCDPVTAACTTSNTIPQCTPALIQAGTICQASGTCTGSPTTCAYSGLNPTPLAQIDGDEIRVTACRSGVPNAATEVHAIYQMVVATPTFTPNGGAVGYGATISWASTTTQPGVAPPTPAALPGTAYHYTFGNPVAADPSCTSPNNAGSTTYTTNSGAPGPTQYKVIACRNGYTQSAIASATFNATLAAPVVSSVPGSPNANPPYAPFNNTSTVTLTSPSTSAAGGKICYTVDGGIPACDPVTFACSGTGVVTDYTNGPGGGPFQIQTDGTVLHAITCATGFTGVSMTPVTFNFTVDAPVVTPGAGSYGTAQDIHIHNGATNNAWVCVNSTNDNPIPTTCADATCGGATGVTCQLLAAGAELTKGGAPFLAQGTNITLHVRADRAGFVASADQRLPYLFGPYSRTIVVDGNNDWSNADDRVLNAVDPAVPGQQYTYVAWDATNAIDAAGSIYFASEGPLLCATCGTRYLDFYLRSSANAGTTTLDTMPINAGAGDSLNTTKVNVHFWFHTDGGSEGVRVWNGTAWGVPLSPINYSVKFGGFATPNGLVEYRVSRAALGLTAANSILVLQSKYEDGGGDAIFAPWGNGDGTPGYVGNQNPAPATNWQFFYANMTAANSPSAAVNICKPNGGAAGTSLGNTPCGP
jgi:hypothetical protein